MSEFAALKAEYVELVGKNPPPMSADALKSRIDAIRAEKAAEAAKDPVNAEQVEPDANADAGEQPADASPPAEQDAPVDLAAEIEELGLVVDEQGDAALEMTASMCGVDINLAPGDPHSCPAAEAARLVRAGFAVPAK